METAARQARRDQALADQRRRKRRYLIQMAIRLSAIPLLLLVPHAFVAPAAILAGLIGLTAVTSGNDWYAAEDLFGDDDDRS